MASKGWQRLKCALTLHAAVTAADCQQAYGTAGVAMKLWLLTIAPRECSAR
jgi:hypothetical protein